MKPRVNLFCASCGYSYPDNLTSINCNRCGGILEYIWDEEYLKGVKFAGDLRFWRYRPVLPSVQKIMTLGEGGTPLQRSQRLAESLNLKNFFLKDETRNPTNSFKDRSAAIITSDAASKGFSSIVCATNGNHGASIAAYSARADISCHLVVPKAMDIGKLAQMMVYRAEIVESGDTIEEAIGRARALEKEMSWYQATTELNPLSIEGLKTISYEILDQGIIPNFIIVAMGSGVTITSLWKGFKELRSMGLIHHLPKLIGVQAEGCSPIAAAYRSGSYEPIKCPEARTEAAAIRVAEPIFGKIALRSLRESGGLAVSISDEDMFSAGREIARFEGIFAEPASASTVACLKWLIESRSIEKTDSIVSLITSSGLKTADILQTMSKRRKSPGLGSMLTTKEKILRRISTGETYGYEIWKAIGKGMTIGAVYQHITDLENRGLAASHIKGKRKYYNLTKRGEQVLSALDSLQVLL